MKVIFPIHPRTKKNILKNKIKITKNIKLIKPLGFFDFVDLEKHAFCVITDSGTVQEECAIFKTPVIVARDSTERPETIESGSAIISGKKIDNILSLMKFQVLNSQNQDKIKDYHVPDVSSKVIKIILSNHI